MGRMSRLHKERRENRVRSLPESSRSRREANGSPSDRITELEDSLKRLADGDFEMSGNLPPEIRKTHLEDILAFESVSTGTALFQGLEAHGVDLPPPDKMDDRQSVEKITEILGALSKLQVFLVGFEQMAPREFYSTLWNQTLWEGCYVEKRIPGAVTIIDVSHSMSRSDLRQYIEQLTKSRVVH